MTSHEPTAPEPLPVPAPDVVGRRLDDEVVLVNLRTNRIFALNATGARFWELLSAGADRKAIETALGLEFHGAPTELSSSIDELIGQLRVEGLVEDSAKQ